MTLNYGRSGWPFTISALFHHLTNIFDLLWTFDAVELAGGICCIKSPHALWRVMCTERITIFDVLKCVLIRSTSCRKCFISMSAIVNTRRLEILYRPECCRSPASETHRASRRLAADCRAALWRSADPVALRISLPSSKRTIFCALIFSCLSNILALSSIAALPEDVTPSAYTACHSCCLPPVSVIGHVLG